MCRLIHWRYTALFGLLRLMISIKYRFSICVLLQGLSIFRCVVAEVAGEELPPGRLQLCGLVIVESAAGLN